MIEVKVRFTADDLLKSGSAVEGPEKETRGGGSGEDLERRNLLIICRAEEQKNKGLQMERV